MPTNTKPSVVILCTDLGMPGGIERAIVNTANALQERGHPVHLLVLAQATTSFYPINDLVTRSCLALDFGINAGGNMLTRKVRLFHHTKLLRKALHARQADVVIASEYMLTIAAVLAGQAHRLISWEHHHYHHVVRNRFWRFLFQRLYPKVRTVVCLNEEEAGLFKKMGCTAVVIPNFIQLPAMPGEVTRGRTLLTMGWLTDTKGVDRIPAIAGGLKLKSQGWNWIVRGAGPCRQDLAGALAAQGVDDCVKVVEPEYAELDVLYGGVALYVLTSRFECFPMVLLEAMASGIPVVAFDCPTGPRNIIHHRIDGILVPDGNVEEMTAAIHDLLGDPGKRGELGDNARAAMQRFSEESVYLSWRQLLESVMAS